MGERLKEARATYGFFSVINKYIRPAAQKYPFLPGTQRTMRPELQCYLVPEEISQDEVVQGNETPATELMTGGRRYFTKERGGKKFQTSSGGVCVAQ